MKLDGALLSPDLTLVPALAKELADLGYDGAFTFEGPHEPFLPLLLAAEHAPNLEIATGLAIAFARNPMIVAQLAYDLHAFSKGRFTLALGTQVKAHVERRFSSTWSEPARRMREFVLAIRAIFACWNEGKKLDFQGDFYTHTLMPPAFHPGPNPYGRPPILVGGVGAKMTEVAAEVADGFLVHPFHTERFVERVTLPAIAKGRARSDGGPFTIACQALVVTGPDDEAIAAARSITRHQIAFYASTPAYKGVLDAEGFGDLQPELQAMTRAGRWGEMAGLVTDELVDRVAVVGTPEEVAKKLAARYDGFAQRIAFASPFRLDPACVRRVLEAYRGLERGTG